jgi:hypothetical protein
VSATDWTERTFKPIRAPDGTVDYGNIDVFELEPGGRYYIEGEWGRLTVAAESANITVS